MDIKRCGSTIFSRSSRANGFFVVTDPDVIPDTSCPPDAMTHLVSLLRRYPHVTKAGLGLRIDDLPPGSDLTRDVRDWESQFWDTELEPGVFEAHIDTTFAVYRPGAPGADYTPAVRTAPPYVARHLPWYDDPANPGAEELFYRARSRPDSTTWHSQVLQPHFAAKLDRRRRSMQRLADHPLLDAWSAEPDLRDEADFTPWAKPGWRSWNAMSPERDFCEFVGLTTRLLQPEIIVETGVGQGFSTRRISREQGSGVHLCFESDPELRTALASLPFFLKGKHRLSAEPTPANEDFRRADLTVLDSDPSYRYEELSRWRESAREGSGLLVHDCGNRHSAGTIHRQLRDMVISLDIPGTFLSNPRGGFFGIHPGPAGPYRLRAEMAHNADELLRTKQELLQTREELSRIRMSLSWRVTQPLRAARARQLQAARARKLRKDL